MGCIPTGGKDVVPSGEAEMGDHFVEYPRIASTDLDDLRLLSEWH
jgi:hypothetical protein